MTTSPPRPSSTSSLQLGLQAPWSRVASSAWLFRLRSWPLHWQTGWQPSLAAWRCSRLLLNGRRPAYAVRRKTDLLLSESLLAYSCGGLYCSRGGALEHRASLVRPESETTRLNTRRQLPRSMPRQRPGTDGRGPLPQSEHRRQSNISSPRSLRFAAWSSAAPLAGGPGRSASSLLRLRRRQPSVSGARLAPAPCSMRGPT